MRHDVDSDLPVAVYGITMILLIVTSIFSWAFLAGSQKCDVWGDDYGGSSEGCKIASGIAGGSQIALICLNHNTNIIRCFCNSLGKEIRRCAKSA